MMKRITATMITIMVFLLSIAVASAETPYDSERSGVGFNESRTMPTDGNVTAYGGNISNVNLSIDIQTPYWTGYYGTVSHSISLQDTGDNSFYNWGSVASTGYVMLSPSSTVDWGSLVPGTSGHAGTEDTDLSLDSVAENVTATFTSNNAGAIDIGASTIGDGLAVSVNTSSNGGNEWQTVLAYDGSDPIYIGVIDQDNQNYAGDASDFQVMVPINASAGSRTYYLYMAVN